MKKIMSIVLAVALVAVMTVSAFAVDTSRVYLQPQVWFQNSTDWSNWTCLQTASGAAQIDLGDTMDVVFIGDAWKGIEAPTYVYGLQILDGTISQGVAADGDQTKIKYEISDIVFKATGYDDYVVSCAGVYEEELTVKMESWGPSNNYGDDITFDFTAVAGGSDGASLTAYFQAIETVSFTLTYLEYNGEGPAGAPAVEETTEEAPADETPAEDGYTAFLMFTTSSWYPAAMEAADHNSVTVTGNGTYTIETDQLAGSSDALVFCVDIMDILVDHPNVTAVLDSIEVDGEVIEFNADAVKYGDIEVDNDHYRIEIRNEWGETLDTVITGWKFAIESTLKVTFTVSGMDAAEEAPADDTPAVEEIPAEDTPADDEAPADTGLALAIVPMVVAAAAVALSKKR